MPSEAPLQLPRIAARTPEVLAHPAWENIRIRLAEAEQPYREALTEALEEARAALRRLRAADNGRPERAASELGALALGPLDPARFAALLEPGESPDPAHLRRFEEAVAALEKAMTSEPSRGPVTLAPRETLRDAVAGELALRGRAFGAVRVLSLLRTGAFREAEHAGLLEGVPFGEWRSLERELAPPVVVALEGPALETVGGLAEFLDGSQKIVLLVEEPCPPAPLARLIAPGTMVVQTREPEDLASLVTWPGPSVAALTPESAVPFAFRPGDGEGTGPTLETGEIPEAPPRRWIGGISPSQQAVGLQLLEAWARALSATPWPVRGGTTPEGSLGESGSAPGSPGDSGTAPRAPDPAERLAAWLLSQMPPDPAGSDSGSRDSG